ncbi:MAG: histidine phosphatase family protein [Anaerovoracaceae bacterium]
MRNLYLVRHGMPDFKDGIKLCIGRTEIDLGETGKEECKKLREFFAKKNISKVYTSPLIRCVNTAKIIADDRLDVEIEPGLMEIFMGEWEGVPLKDIKKDLESEPVTGEKRINGLMRMERALKAILERSSGDIICVAHAGINCAFISKIIGEPLEQSRGIRQPYACYNHFEIDDNMNFRAIEIGMLPK